MPPCDSMRAVMVSRTERRDEREKTLGLLRSCEVTPLVFENGESGEPASHAMHAEVSRGALETTRGPLLFVEDDVDVDPDLLSWTLREFLRAGDRIVYLYVPASRYYPAEIQRAIEEGDPVQRGLYPMVYPGGIFGSQAFCLPESVRAEIVEEGPWWRIRGGFDLVLREYMRSALHRPLVAVPNPIQHRAPKGCTLTTRPHFSRTYGLDWLP